MYLIFRYILRIYILVSLYQNMQCWIYIEFDFEFLFQVVGTISLRLFDVYHDYKENDAAQLYHKMCKMAMSNIP